jgi:hypothetical protein
MCPEFAQTLTAIPASALMSDSEFDAIVKARAEAEAERKALRNEELNGATVNTEERSVLANGRIAIIREIQAPRRFGSSRKPGQAAMQKAEPLPEQMKEWQTLADKKHVSLMLSATVYNRAMTRISWHHDSEEFVAFTNADFHYLSGIYSLETEDNCFMIFMGVGDANAQHNPYHDEVLPSASVFSDESSEYAVIRGDLEHSKAFDGIEALLDHYDANLPELKIEYQQRRALSAAQKRYDAKHPNEPETLILNFWNTSPRTPKQ